MLKIDIADKSLMMIFLLEECNFTCCHCVREDEPMECGYKLSFQQLRQCLKDCQNLESVSWIHFSGGEPTLWREDEQCLPDLLTEISQAGFTPGFTTNGSSFLNFDQCYDFFKRYTETSTNPLRLYLSIDTFHRNFDPDSGRAKSLDNVVKSGQKLPGDRGKLIDVRVGAAISKETESLLPEMMVDYYKSMGVTFHFFPVRPVGKAKSMRNLCPDLDSDKPADQGAYHRFHRMKQRSSPAKTVDSTKAAHIVLIGDNYWVSVNDSYEFASRWRKISSLGRLSKEIILAYSKPLMSGNRYNL